MSGGPCERERREWRLAKDASSLRSARQNVASVVKGAVDPKTLQDLLVIANELVTNAIRHGEAFEDGTVVLSVDVLERSVKVAVADAGLGFDRSASKLQARGGHWWVRA